MKNHQKRRGSAKTYILEDITILLNMDRELVCILSLSACFMLMFAGESTLLNMQKIVVSSIADDHPGFKVDGYTVVGVMYSTFAVSVWFGPYVNYSLGSKLTMIISSFGYWFKVSSFLYEDGNMLYVGSVVLGISAGILWPAQGHYMIENSSFETTPRNVGIFAFIFASSGVLGNTFVYYTFHGKKYIGQSTRNTVLKILMAINTLAVIAFILLPKSKERNKLPNYGPIQSIKKSLSVLTSSKMLWLIPTFCYAGLQQSFSHGIYSPSVGFTLAFGDSAKELVALSGIFMSIGALLGSFCPIAFSGWIRRHSFARRLIVLIGVLAQLTAFAITFVNLPDSAIFGNTSERSIIKPSAGLAMLGSVLLCFGDACLSIQIYSIIGDCYRESSAEACALYKFFKAVVVAMSFFWFKYFGLHTLVVFIAAAAGFGFMGIFMADLDNSSQYIIKKNTNSRCREDYEPINGKNEA